MAEKLNQKENFLKGIIKDNPVFVMLLGMCPTLGVTSSAFNGHCDRTANPMSKEDQDLVISSSEMAKMFPKPKAPCM